MFLTKKFSSVIILIVVLLITGCGGGGGGTSTTTTDTTAPVITLNGSSTVSVLPGATDYSDAGATATDNVDGTLTSSIEVLYDEDLLESGTLTDGTITTVEGTYTITYSVSDDAGNYAEVYRTIIVKGTDVKGKFVDAAVGGLNYICNPSKREGVTGTDGGFTCTTGDTVKFFMGDVPLGGEITAEDGYVTPDLLYSDDTTSQNGLAAVLLTLDNDGDPSNGISLEPTVIEAFQEVVQSDTTNTDGTVVDFSVLDDAKIETVTTDVNGYITTNYPKETVVIVAKTITEAESHLSETSTSIDAQEDVINPLVTLIGSSKISLEVGDNYLEQGASATDDVDGDIGVLISGSVDTSTEGLYVLTYKATDSSGNSAQVKREVTIVATPDTTKPVVTLNGDETISKYVNEDYTYAGAIAIDDIDGRLPVTRTGSVLMDTVGNYKLTYTAIDSAGNIGAATRTVSVIALPAQGDTTKPVITLIGDLVVTIDQGDAYIDEGATAKDDTDGTISGLVETTNNVDTSTPGTYTVTYKVSDKAGNSVTATRTVIVRDVDTTNPVVTLIGSASLDIYQGSTYSDAGATATDNVDGNLRAVMTSNLDVDTLGNYTITWTATDARRNTASKERTVNVVTAPARDDTAPIVTLIGSSPVNAYVGYAYSDAGAIAVDGVDGPLAPVKTITFGGNSVDSIDTSTDGIGTYIVTWTATDNATNSDFVTRTVVVKVDDVNPVVTLTGNSSVTLDQGATSYTDAGATATDNLDGDLTPYIKSNTVNVNVPGTYSVVWAARDLTGNEGTVTRTVIVPSSSTN